MKCKCSPSVSQVPAKGEHCQHISHFTVYCIIVCCIVAHDIEFAVNVMVVADQLLMSRLKQICESLIVSQLTLDNVTQVYQLASTYNTLQLKVISAYSWYPT